MESQTTSCCQKCLEPARTEHPQPHVTFEFPEYCNNERCECHNNHENEKN